MPILTVSSGPRPAQAGSIAGSMLPFLLLRLGLDPASASALFVATLGDVTGLVIYFSVARALLPL